MAPLGGEPGVIVVEPADHRADVERRMNRFQLPIRPRNARAVYESRAGDNRTQPPCAFRITQREQAATEGVDQIVTRGFAGFMALGNMIGRLVGDFDDDGVGFWPNVGNRRAHKSRFGQGSKFKVRCSRWEWGR